MIHEFNFSPCFTIFQGLVNFYHWIKLLCMLWGKITLSHSTVDLLRLLPCGLVKYLDFFFLPQVWSVPEMEMTALDTWKNIGHTPKTLFFVLPIPVQAQWQSSVAIIYVVTPWPWPQSYGITISTISTWLPGQYGRRRARKWHVGSLMHWPSSITIITHSLLSRSSNWP